MTSKWILLDAGTCKWLFLLLDRDISERPLSPCYYESCRAEQWYAHVYKSKDERAVKYKIKYYFGVLKSLHHVKKIGVFFLLCSDEHYEKQ